MHHLTSPALQGCVHSSSGPLLSSLLSSSSDPDNGVNYEIDTAAVAVQCLWRDPQLHHHLATLRQRLAITTAARESAAEVQIYSKHAAISPQSRCVSCDWQKADSAPATSYVDRQ